MAARGGRKAVARRLLERAARKNSGDARVWIWLTATTDDLHEQHEYLQKAVASEPHNASARKGLRVIQQKLKDGGSFSAKDALRVDLDAKPGNNPPPVPGIIATESTSFPCPACGAVMRYDAPSLRLRCEFCGHSEASDPTHVADEREQDLDATLHSESGHNWGVGHHQFDCTHCGATSLLDDRKRSSSCPYCGANHVVEMGDGTTLIAPQAIAISKIEAVEALELAREWMDEGYFSPDDLGETATEFQLRAAYYSFWTFDGLIMIPWSCEVARQGSGDSYDWIYRSGTLSKGFDDVLVSGSSAIERMEIRSVEPFVLKELISFDSGTLAGWDVILYDRSTADASLVAREQVVNEMRRELRAEVEPGSTKRNVNFGAGAWSGMTYKHILLPLWVGTYHYEGDEYHVLVNGQTGEVGGSKPNDPVKVVGYGLLIAASVIVIAILVAILVIFYSGPLLALLGF